MSASENYVEISHLGTPFIFEIATCKLAVTEQGLDFGVFTKPNKMSPFGHLSPPHLHIEAATVRASSIDELKCEELQVAIGWDTDEESKDDNIFRIYISQHEALNNNCVRISRRPNDDIEIRWSAESQDFLDFRNPNCSVEVSCVIDVANLSDC